MASKVIQAASEIRNPWLEAAKSLSTPLVFVCPVCRSRGTLDHAYIGDLSKRVGYLMLWCSACLTAVSVSRALIPEGERKAFGFDQAPDLSHLKLVPLSDFEESGSK